MGYASSQTNEAKSSCSSCCNDIDVQDQDSFELQSDTQVVIEQTQVQNEPSSTGLVTFDENEDGQQLVIKSDLYIDQSNQPTNIELAKFLSRPVPIASYSWTIGSSIRQTFRPWYLFMNQTAIKKRLDNYHLFKGNLHLKFVINASPFYYGCAIAYYRPDLGIPSTVITENANLITASQLPNVYLYPASNTGATMVLPFIYHKEWLNLTSAADVQDMGAIYLREVNVLKTASTSTRPITITVYAWLEDYQLSGPTFEFSLQSGTSDEYGEGIVSKPASAIARAAGMLEDVPIIGKFATATQIGASAISSVAKLFGFTDVPVISDVHSFKPDPFPHMASTDIGQSMNKLTLDSKNELSIDPTIIGANTGDELNIKNLTSRETYITKFTWQSSDIPNDRLFNIRINPDLKGVVDQLTQYVFTPTPLWLVAKQFYYWRGDMEYRFKVICSKYHQGRIRISWSPNGDLGATANTTTEVYTKIVDISQTTDFRITIPYMQPAAFLESGDDNAEQWDDVNAISPSPVTSNGILTVRVLNELTAPTDAADVDIIVFVRGGENLEFMAPRSLEYTVSPFTTQSGVEYDNEDIDYKDISMQDAMTPSNINLIYGGEHITSLRTLLRRTNKYRTVLSNSTLTSSGLIGKTFYYMNRLPISPGFDLNGINTGVGPISGSPEPFNWVANTTLAFIGQCFLACRGSIIYTVSPLNPELSCEMAISRPRTFFNIAASSYLGINSEATTVNSSTALDIFNVRNGGVGRAVTNNRTMSSITASMPYYSKYKFRGCDPSTAVLGSSNDHSSVDIVVIDITHTPKTSISGNTEFANGNAFTFYVSAGTDFTFSFFLFVPVQYKYKSSVTP